jgi:hypothetical protein
MSQIPFFENSIKNKDKSLSDEGVIKDLQKDINILAFSIQKLPFMIKMGINMMGITNSVLAIKSSLDDMVNKNKIDDNDVKVLKSNFKNLKIKLENSRGHEKELKSYLGNNYLEVFNAINRMINK